MTKKLFVQAIVKYLAGVVLLGLLIFLPAGTLRFPNGWLLMALLEKRLNAKEKQGEQKEVVCGSGLMFIAAFVLAGLNFRFGWLRLPDWAVWTASVLFLLAYLMWGEVLRENAWLSRTVEVQEGQCRRPRSLRRGAPSDVQRLGAAVPVDAAHPELAAVLSGDALLSAADRQAHPERGEAAEKGAAGL